MDDEQRVAHGLFPRLAVGVASSGGGVDCEPVVQGRELLALQARPLRRERGGRLSAYRRAADPVIAGRVVEEAQQGLVRQATDLGNDYLRACSPVSIVK